MATKIVDKFIEKENETIEFIKDKYSKDMLDSMNENTFKLYTLSLELVSLANEVLKEQSEMLDRIDKKIDALKVQKN